MADLDFFAAVRVITGGAKRAKFTPVDRAITRRLSGIDRWWQRLIGRAGALQKRPLCWHKTLARFDLNTAPVVIGSRECLHFLEATRIKSQAISEGQPRLQAGEPDSILSRVERRIDEILQAGRAR